MDRGQDESGDSCGDMKATGETAHGMLMMMAETEDTRGISDVDIIGPIHLFPARKLGDAHTCWYH